MCLVLLYRHASNIFQPETWNFDYGKPYTKETEDEIIDALKPSHIAGLTLLGGEPFEPENQRELVKLLRRVRKELPEKNIWSFTGFILDQDLLDGGRKHCEVTDEMLYVISILNIFLLFCLNHLVYSTFCLVVARNIFLMHLIKTTFHQ